MYKNLNYFIFLLFFFFLCFYILPNASINLPYNDVVWYKQMNSGRFQNLNPNREKYPNFKNKAYYYRKKLMYLDKKGELMHHVRLDSQSLASMGRDNYVVYEKIGDQISYFKKNGEISSKLSTKIASISIFFKF